MQSALTLAASPVAERVTVPHSSGEMSPHGSRGDRRPSCHPSPESSPPEHRSKAEQEQSPSALRPLKGNLLELPGGLPSGRDGDGAAEQLGDVLHTGHADTSVMGQTI